MKKIILITMLMSAVFAQSDCNKNNWRDYYNSDGKDMSDCDLRWRKPLKAQTLQRKPFRRNLSRKPSQTLKAQNFEGANLTRNP